MNLRICIIRYVLYFIGLKIHMKKSLKMRSNYFIITSACHEFHKSEDHPNRKFKGDPPV